MSKHWFVILVARYGAILHRDTPEGAEDMRAHMARREQAVARLRLAHQTEVQIVTPSPCWNHPGFNNRVPYVCDCESCGDRACRYAPHGTVFLAKYGAKKHAYVSNIEGEKIRFTASPGRALLCKSSDVQRVRRKWPKVSITPTTRINV